MSARICLSAAAMLLLIVALGCPDDGVESTTPQQRLTATEHDKPSRETSSAELKRLSEDVQPEDWPCWRGADGSGVSAETNWTADWLDSGPKIAWKKDVGTGYSAVVAVGDCVFTMGHTAGQEFVYCLAAEDGEQIWKHGYQGQLLNNLNAGGPAATPCYDQGRLFTLGREGQLFCWNATDGEIVWKQDLQSVLGTPLPEWGFCSSPVVLGDHVLVDGGRIVAFNKATGDLAWQSDEHEAGYGAVQPFLLEGRQFAAALTNDGLKIVDAADGGQVAFHPWESHYNTSSTTPIVEGDLIFISTGYQHGCALLRLAGGDLEEVYANDDMSNHMNNCVLVDGFLYGFDGNSHDSRNVELVCMDFASGQVQWRQRGLGCGALMATDGKLIALGDRGELAIVAASPNGYEEFARAEVVEPRCWTMPVLAHGRIYCRNDAGDLVCVEVRE